MNDWIELKVPEHLHGTNNRFKDSSKTTLVRSSSIIRILEIDEKESALRLQDGSTFTVLYSKQEVLDMISGKGSEIEWLTQKEFEKRISPS